MSEPLARLSVDTSPAAVTLEDTIASIWAEVLGTAEVPRKTDSFFELGGESISMMMVLFRVNEQFGVDLPPATPLERPVLAAFCERVESARRAL